MEEYSVVMKIKMVKKSVLKAAIPVKFVSTVKLVLIITTSTLYKKQVKKTMMKKQIQKMKKTN